MAENNECAALPSSNSALRIWQGDPKAVLAIGRDLASRAALIGAGMAIAGERKHLVRNALAGSVMIEAFVLAWVGYERWQRRRHEAAQQNPVLT